MKILITLFLLFSLSPAFADHDHHAHLEASKKGLQSGVVNPEGELITVTASGLVCDFCAQAVEKIFMKNPSISGIDVNLADKNITISLNTGATLSDEVINKEVLNAGYNLIGIHRQPPHKETSHE